MRRFKKGCAVALALALSMTLLTGCGDDSSKKGELSDTSATASDASATDAEYATIEEMVDAYAADVELGQYKGIEYEDTTVEVTDEDVQKQVDSFVDSQATYDEDKESEAKDGDTVNIDFVGTVDGEEFDGGSTDGAGYDLVLGSGSFVDDFEDQIVGHKAGDTFTVSVTFPDDYNDELGGKDAEFETTLNYVKVEVPATYSDELVAENTNYDTMEEYEAGIREDLEESAADTALASAQNEIMVKVINNCVINNLPASVVQSNTDKTIERLQSTAESYSIDYANYIYYMYGYDDEEEFENYVYQICEEAQKERMVMCAIAKAEGITVTDEEADEYLASYAEENSVDEDTVRESISDVDIKYSALAEKVMNMLLENAVATAPESTATDAAEEE